MLISSEYIADGEVDERSIVDVHPRDLDGFDQCHFFAGIGGWSYALRLAGVPDNYKVWTGSCPCQPFSSATHIRKGLDDKRHLWPEFRRLITKQNPSIILGEQVASNSGLKWFDRVSVDLEAEGYAIGAVNLPAACVGAPHNRPRLWWLGYCKSAGRRSHPGRPPKLSIENWPTCRVIITSPGSINYWSSFDTVECDDGQRRRIEPGARPLVDGVPSRMAQMYGLGNAITPQVAALFITAAIDACKNL